MKLKSLAFSIVLIAFVVTSVYAQNTQLKIARNSMAKLNEAISEKADFKKQLSIIGEGIKAIEIAEKDKRTKKWAETWAIKAYLSSYISIIDNNEVNANKYFDWAQQAIKQAEYLDKFQSNQTLINAANNNIHVKIQREGQISFSNMDYVSAFEQLKTVSDFIPTDTLLALNVSICAQKLRKYDDILTYLLRAKDNGIKNPIVYQHIATIYQSKFENELAIKTLEDGLKINPQNTYLTNDYINLLLDNEKYEKAKSLLENILKTDNNKVLNYLLGYLEQNKFNELNLADTHYKKAINSDFSYFDALYQLSLLYIQNANLALKNKDVQKFKSNINRAEFTLLQAHEINVYHKNTTQLLIDIYTRKNKLDKVQELKRLLNEF